MSTSSSMPEQQLCVTGVWQPMHTYSHPCLPSLQVGDVVTLAPSRPLSKTKRFVVESVVKKAQ